MASYFRKGWSGNLTRTAFDKLDDPFADPTVMGDFNGDGHVDILLNFCESSEYGADTSKPVKSKVILLAGDGKGGFTDATAKVLDVSSLGASMRKVATGDFNGDGQLDIAAALNREDGRAGNPGTMLAPQVVLISNDGKLDVVKLGVQIYAHALGVGDLNRDGRDDIIIGGFDVQEGAPSSTASFLQQPDGTMSAPQFLDSRNGLSEVIGDFDGDGDNEIADEYSDYDDPLISGLRVTEVNADGTLGDVVVAVNPPLRVEDGVTWNGDPGSFAVRVDSNGKEFVDQGLNDLKAADFNGDGKDEVLGIRFGFEMHYIKGVLHEDGAEARNGLELFALDDDGLEPMQGYSIKGWTPAPYGILDVKILDFNGDGHLDLFVPWAYDTPEDPGIGARLFLNDGAAHFVRVKTSLLPTVRPNFGFNFDPIDANEDGIMDILVRADSFVTGVHRWDDNSDTVYLGTTKFFTGPGYSDPAFKGAAGFNEQYYLNTHADARKAVKAHKYDDGLDHYLNVGKAKGYFGFAVDTHIFGSDKADKIKAREGEERLDGGLGKDKLTGGASADMFVFSTKLGPANVDKIKDFEHGVDTIALDHHIFGKIGSTLDDAEFYAAAGAIAGHDKNDRIVYDTTTGRLSFDVDGNKAGGKAAVHFATFTAMPDLDANGFIII
jgi:Ca2+-binding RTX toxin-like protein